MNLSAQPSSVIHDPPSQSQRHSRRHKSVNALPAFSFGQSSNFEGISTKPATPPLEPAFEESERSSPTKHRRFASEFIGAGGAAGGAILVNPSPSHSQTNSPNVENFTPSVNIPTRGGHKHRRSGAISSQDISAVTRQTGNDPVQQLGDLSLLPISRPSSTGPSESSRSGADSPALPRTPSPTRVQFAPNVTVIAPPVPEIPARFASRSPKQPFFNQPRPSYDLPESPLLESPMLDDSMNDFGPAITQNRPSSLFIETISLQPPAESDFDIAMLNQNFDDDPTSAISEVPSQVIPLTPSMPSTPKTYDTDSTVIDLDDAEEPWHSTSHAAKGKSFSKARRSMHSAALSIGFAGPGMHYHRRAESAPELDPFDYHRPEVVRLNSASASEKGFTMEDVFEEDEEEARDSLEAAGSSFDTSIPTEEQRQSLGCLVGGTYQTIGADKMAPMASRTSTSPRSTTSDSNAGSNRHVSDSIQFSFPLKQEALDADDADNDYGQGPTRDYLGSSNTAYATSSRATRYADDVMQSPPVTPDVTNESTASASSTPRLDTDHSSYISGRQLNVPHTFSESGNDLRASRDTSVPSLTSGKSTTTNGQMRYPSSLISPAVTDGNSWNGSTSSVYSRPEWRRKRSSIVSLSRLVGNPFGDNRSKLSIEQNARCQTSQGVAVTKERKPSRLSRFLKIGRKGRGAATEE